MADEIMKLAWGGVQPKHIAQCRLHGSNAEDTR